jgi:hypothetical protein
LGRADRGNVGRIACKGYRAGKSIKNMKFKKSKENATDRWLIEQIKPLGKWIPIVYTKTSGAIHFSDFHISQLIQQFKAAERLGNPHF